MSKPKNPTMLSHASREKNKTVDGIPLIVAIWAFGLGLVGYLGSRIAVSQHPLHWASGAVGVLLGIVIGYIWYLKRGDINPF